MTNYEKQEQWSEEYFNSQRTKFEEDNNLKGNPSEVIDSSGIYLEKIID